ncbi:MAG: pyridoxamine 5'-phosphate oxidase family protein [Clostridia bacterium]|nr:pyridoxamine 5'-phosphate oxidase family protein [Clostridia bacterium]
MTRREQAVTDIAEITRILDTAKVIHIGLVDDGEPYVVPMNYGYTMQDGRLTVYLHGANTGKKIDILRKNPKVFFELVCDTVSFEGKIACQYGMAYASIMGKGVATLVDDLEEKKYGLSVLMKTQTGKDFAFTDRMVGIVQIIRIDVEKYTAKHRPMPKKG